MPEYEYKCKSCKRTFTQVKQVKFRHKGRCRHCGGVGVKQLTPPLIGGFRERDVDLFDDKRRKMDTVHVSTKEQLVGECRKRGLVHRDIMYHDKEE